MKKKKASIFILSVAMTASLILGGILSVSASVSEEQNSTDPVIFYDFESGNVSGSTVKNTGSKANSDAELVTGDGGISVSQGKLVFNQEKSASADESKNLGHLRLPDDMFADMQAFTFVIDVYDLYISDNSCGFLSFLTKDPAQYGYGSGIENDGIEINYTWDPIAQGWTTAAANPTLNRSDYNLMVQALSGSSTIQSCFAPTPLRYTDGQYAFAFDGTSEFSVYVNGALAQTLSGLSANFFKTKVFNRIGGYLYDFARGSVKSSFDNIALYDRVLSAEELKEISKSTASSDAQKAAVFYDFTAAEGNVVKNMGSRASSDGTIVANNGDVRVEHGKLVISQTGNSTENGYFKLPDNLFAGATEFTMQFEIESLNIGDAYSGLLSFSNMDPAATDMTAAGGPGKTAEVSWAWNSVTNRFSIVTTPWGQSSSTSSFEAGRSVMTLIYSDMKLMVFCDNALVLVSEHSAENAQYFQQFVFNKFGGYLYNWGRSAAQVTIDNFAFYDYAFSGGMLNSLRESAESISFDLPSDASALTDPAFMLTDGTAGQAAEFTVRETVDFNTQGLKYYVADVEGQLTPARVILHTRDLLDWSDEIEVKYENLQSAFPATVAVSYSDGTSGTAEAEWEEYVFDTTAKDVTGVLTDAAGRTALATLRVTGVGAGMDDLVQYVQKIDAMSEDFVLSTYTEFMSLIKAEYDAARSVISAQEGAVENVYNALVEAYEENYSVLISNAKLKEAISLYSDGGRAAFAPQNEREAYEKAFETVSGMLQECDSEQSVTEAVAALKSAREQLRLSVENYGFYGISEQENGLGSFTSRTSTFWRQTDDVSYAMQGDFELTFTINSIEYVQNIECAFSFGILTGANSIMYRVGANPYDAKFSDRSINGVFSDVTNIMAADGTFPDPAKGGISWTTNLNFDSPVSVRVSRVADKENEGFAYYHFYLLQNGNICHAYYDYLEDTSDARIAFGSQKVVAQISDIRIDALPIVPEYDSQDGYAALGGSEANVSDGLYGFAEKGTLLSAKALAGTYDLVSVKFILRGETDETSRLTFALATKSGFYKDYFILSADDGTGASSVSYYHYDASGQGTAALSEKIESGKESVFAVTRRHVEDYVLIDAYILDGDKVLLSVQELVSYYVLPAKLLVGGSNFAVSTAGIKDISPVIVEEIDEGNYSPESVAAYRAKLEEIGLDIKNLIEATDEMLASMKVQIEEAQKLLQLAKIVSYETLPDLQVELNAPKVQLPTRVRVTYDTGKTELLKITWDTPDTSVAGDFVLKGYVTQKDGSQYEVSCNLKVSAPQGSEGGERGGCAASFGYGAGAVGAVCVAGALLLVLKRRKRSDV